MQNVSSSNSQAVNVPKLRFPGFEGEWNSSRLDEFCNINPKTTELPDMFFYIDLESVVSGVLVKETIVKKEEAPSRAQRLLCRNDVIYQMVRPYQKNNYLFTVEKAFPTVASTGYAQLRTINNACFLYQLINTQTFTDEVLVRCTGSSYPAINSNDMKEIEVSFPAIKEQGKIADFLFKIDERIKKQQQLVDSLKLYKRGVSNALFTQKISFEDKSSEWTATTMGKVCNITMGQSPDSDSYNTDNVGLPLVQGNADMKNRITHPQRYTSSPIKTAEIGDVILSVRAPVGTTGRANKKICLGRGVCSISGENNDFLYHYFVENEAYWKRVEQGGTFTAISGNDIANMPIFLPSNEEIEKIAFFLNLIDDRISAAEETLELLFEMRRSLLQQMFI